MHRVKTPKESYAFQSSRLLLYDCRGCVSEEGGGGGGGTALPGCALLLDRANGRAAWGPLWATAQPLHRAIVYVGHATPRPEARAALHRVPFPVRGTLLLGGFVTPPFLLCHLTSAFLSTIETPGRSTSARSFLKQDGTRPKHGEVNARAIGGWLWCVSEVH